jgi:hypothetical protein
MWTILIKILDKLWKQGLDLRLSSNTLNHHLSLEVKVTRNCELINLN